MAHVDEPSPGQGWRLLSRPWPYLAASVALLGVGEIILQADPGANAAAVLFIAAGILVALTAVAIRLRTAGERFEERLITAGVIALAAVMPFWAACTLPREWDTAILLLGVVVTVLLVGALLCLLPRLPRLFTASLLAVVHFGGIVTAINSVDPPGGREVSWLVRRVWTDFYRPYLEFMFLGNAYHFYSPEPGPPTLLWFYLEYEDGSSRWVKMPLREHHSNKTAYLRRIAMSEGTNTWNPNMPWDPQRYENRRRAGEQLGVPTLENTHLAPIYQYRFTLNLGRRLTRYYAHYAATHYPHPENPDLKVKRVKVYRVTRNFIQPGELARDVSPWDPAFLFPYYQGTFDAKGNYAKDPLTDPFLFWVIPLKREPNEELRPPLSADARKKLTDPLQIHAHSE
ncbi:MAG TPA: hypothetical protein VFA26_25195 [Gemmataceae bacterium]|nr:hypothetical protein [Gemmataceae bacterium]